MKPTICRAFVTLGVLFSLTTFAQFQGLPGCSQEFYNDVASAEKTVNDTQSIDPLLKLQPRYTNPVERASLEISIGLDYNQRTGVVNPTNAVKHFTTALDHEDLPDRTRLAILLWRGGSLEQMGKADDAMKDYLRGLLGCSYYDLSAGWPEILMPKVGISINSSDPENSQRAKDYSQYRQQINLQTFLLTQRYYFIDGAKRVRRGMSDDEITKILQALSPDSDRCKKVIESINSENKRPWP